MEQPEIFSKIKENFLNNAYEEGNNHNISPFALSPELIQKNIKSLSK